MVSVIVPTYNHRGFIGHTLDSVFTQTFTDFEVIVVNDGSPDDTVDVLAPLASDARILYFEQSNQGQSFARNRGLREARGKYIAFLDDDDVWPPDKLEWQVAFLEEHAEVATVGGTLQLMDEFGSVGRIGAHHSEITFESLFAGNPFFSPGQTLIRSSVLKQVGGMDEEIWGADDWDLWFRISKRFNITMLDRLALYYRVHAGNASKQTARLLKACCTTIERHLKEIAPGEQERLRLESHRSIYYGFGATLAEGAKSHLRNRRLVEAMRSLGGLYPLGRSILLDRRLRRTLLNHLTHR